MIPTHEILFEVTSHGFFLLTGEGITYQGRGTMPASIEDPELSRQMADAAFQELDGVHRTPLDVVDQIADAFMVPSDHVRVLETRNLNVAIDPPDANRLY
jgi:hypothetical protein